MASCPLRLQIGCAHNRDWICSPDVLWLGIEPPTFWLWNRLQPTEPHWPGLINISLHFLSFFSFSWFFSYLFFSFFFFCIVIESYFFLFYFIFIVFFHYLISPLPPAITTLWSMSMSPFSFLFIYFKSNFIFENSLLFQFEWEFVV